jgi:hypothetical protein
MERTIHSIEPGREYIYISADELILANKKKTGWYHIRLAENDIEGVYDRITKKVSKSECRALGLDPNSPTVFPIEEVSTADAVESIAKNLANEINWCAESKRQGQDVVATHIVQLNSGVIEYRHFSKLGPKNQYKWARNL